MGDPLLFPQRVQNRGLSPVQAETMEQRASPGVMQPAHLRQQVIERF